MPGSIPKPAAQRRRRNITPALTRLPHDGYSGPIPRLPDRLKAGAATRAWWRLIWRSPMANAWLEGDIPGLLRLAMLTDHVHAGTVVPVELVEIRHLEDRYGLSPMARRRLQWEVMQATGGEALAAEPLEALGVAAGSVRDRVLRLVEEA